MDAQFIEKMKKELLIEKENLRRELESLEEEQEGSTLSQQAGENDIEESFADTASTTFERERDDSLIWNVKDLIHQVDRALKSAKNGTYGTCSNCDEEIDQERLEAIPYTDTCLSCKKKQ